MKYTIELNDNQLHLLKEACEYLGRNAIGQRDFRPPLLEERIDEKRCFAHGHTLLDMWKVIMHEYCKNESGANIHQYPVYKMGQEPLMEIYQVSDNQGRKE